MLEQVGPPVGFIFSFISTCTNPSALRKDTKVSLSIPRVNRTQLQEVPREHGFQSTDPRGINDLRFGYLLDESTAIIQTKIQSNHGLILPLSTRMIKSGANVPFSLHFIV